MSETQQQSSVCDFQPTQRRPRDWLNHYHSFAWRRAQIVLRCFLFVSLLEVRCGTLPSEVEVGVETIFFSSSLLLVLVVLRAKSLPPLMANDGCLAPQTAGGLGRRCVEPGGKSGCWTDTEVALLFVLWHNSESWHDGSVILEKKKEKLDKEKKKKNVI